MASFHPSSHYSSAVDVEGVPLTSGPGFYKGNVVYVKKVDKKSVDLTRDIRKELIHVSFTHTHMSMFHVTCCFDAFPFLFFSFCFPFTCRTLQ